MYRIAELCEKFREKNLPCPGHGTPEANSGTVPGNQGRLATLDTRGVRKLLAAIDTKFHWQLAVKEFGNQQ